MIKCAFCSLNLYVACSAHFDLQYRSYHFHKMTAADTAVTLYRDFMSSLACGSALTDEHVGAWGTLERAVNQLDAASRRTVHGIVSNVLQHGGAYVAIERMSNDGIEDLEKSLRSLVLGGAGE